MNRRYVGVVCRFCFSAELVKIVARRTNKADAVGLNDRSSSLPEERWTEPTSEWMLLKQSRTKKAQSRLDLIHFDESERTDGRTNRPAGIPSSRTERTKSNGKEISEFHRPRIAGL